MRAADVYVSRWSPALKKNSRNMLTEFPWWISALCIGDDHCRDPGGTPDPIYGDVEFDSPGSG